MLVNLFVLCGVQAFCGRLDPTSRGMQESCRRPIPAADSGEVRHEQRTNSHRKENQLFKQENQLSCYLHSLSPSASSIHPTETVGGSCEAQHGFHPCW